MSFLERFKPLFERLTGTQPFPRLLASDDLAKFGISTVGLGSVRRLPPDLTKKLDRAIASHRRARIRYRSGGAPKPASRTVDPLGLHHVKGHLYLVAHDHRRDAVLTFKLDRITAVDVLADKAASHPDFDIHARFARSAKIWTGDEVDVAVRLSKAVAHFVHEYPLVPHQTLSDEKDGAVIVRARVADAEALKPVELRAAVASELRQAAVRYFDATPTLPSESDAVRT